MKRNPKKRAGLIGIAALAAGLAVMLWLLVPVWQEADREAAMTPTPVPPMPESVMAVTRDPSLPTAAPVLRQGARGDEVKMLQARLTDLGYYHDEVDGQFGAQTSEAVIRFQRANGLEPDGIVGEETKAVLYSPQAKPYSGDD